MDPHRTASTHDSTVRPEEFRYRSSRPLLSGRQKLRQVSNYVDDWLGYADDFETLFENFKSFLIGVCLEFNITLNTTKTRFGFPQAQFFGFTVDENGTRLADKYLCPIRNMVPPEDISELRRVLGLFVVSRKYLRNYARPYHQVSH